MVLLIKVIPKSAVGLQVKETMGNDSSSMASCSLVSRRASLAILRRVISIRDPS